MKNYYKAPLIIFTILSLVVQFNCKPKSKQEAVKIVINKLRTSNDLAKNLAKTMQDDVNLYNEFLQSNDSLKLFDRDSNTIMSAIIPNTYEIYKGSSVRKVLKKIIDFSTKFWNAERLQKASALGFSPHQIYTIASIVEEETTNNADKGNVASVYLNRMKIGMKLEADPTLKFALKDFAITRITLKHRDAAATSPYSTYANKGLPPGPICTPSTITIDAVLNAPSTDYIFFVAKPNFSGLSNFTKDYKVHLQNGAIYHKFLDSLEKAKKIK
jgi:UPF0755 protein